MLFRQIFGNFIVICGFLACSKRFFICNFEGYGIGFRLIRFHFFQRSIRIEIFCREINAGKGTHRFGSIAVFSGDLIVIRTADAEQIPAVAEQTVVCPIRCRRADRYHGYVVHQEHNDCEDRKTQPTVGNDLIDLIGGRKLADVLFLVAVLYKTGDVDIPLVGDDAFRIVVEFLFSSRDIGLNVRHGVFRNV